jgi:diketogulonate reductase-like aldo/keto reductase
MCVESYQLRRYRLIDTARSYDEDAVGRAFVASAVRREDIFLATKASDCWTAAEVWQAVQVRECPRKLNQLPSVVLRCLLWQTETKNAWVVLFETSMRVPGVRHVWRCWRTQGSLRALRTSYLDLYLLHAPMFAGSTPTEIRYMPMFNRQRAVCNVQQPTCNMQSHSMQPTA